LTVPFFGGLNLPHLCDAVDEPESHFVGLTLFGNMSALSEAYRQMTQTVAQKPEPRTLNSEPQPPAHHNVEPLERQRKSISPADCHGLTEV